MRDSDVIFEWRVHPLREDPRRAMLFALVMMAVPVAVWWSFRSAGWVLLTALLLAGALHRFWLPLRYRLSEEELESRQGIFRATRRLADFRRVVFEPKGAFLSPFAEPSRLEQYRGVFLPYPEDAEALKSFLRGKFPGGESVGER